MSRRDGTAIIHGYTSNVIRHPLFRWCNWVHVHLTVDPQLTFKHGYEAATGVEQDGGGSVDARSRAIDYVEPGELPGAKPPSLFGYEALGDQSSRTR
jgi:hypothetical protein